MELDEKPDYDLQVKSVFDSLKERFHEEVERFRKAMPQPVLILTLPLKPKS